VIDKIMVPQISTGSSLQRSRMQRVRSLTSEYGKRNVGGEVLADCSGNGVVIDETFSGPAFRSNHAGAEAAMPLHYVLTI
jgi:hypothetical protein